MHWFADEMLERLQRRTQHQLKLGNEGKLDQASQDRLMRGIVSSQLTDLPSLTCAASAREPVQSRFM